MEDVWRVIYSLHTKSNHYTQFTKLGQTDSVQNVNVRLFGGTDKINSVGAIFLGLGHNLISVRPIT